MTWLRPVLNRAQRGEVDVAFVVGDNDLAYLRRLHLRCCRAGCDISAVRLRPRATSGPDAGPRPDGTLGFGMLETIREYTLEQLAATGELAAARRRHTEFFVRLAE